MTETTVNDRVAHKVGETVLILKRIVSSREPFMVTFTNPARYCCSQPVLLELAL
jgi:hypothetical protein